MRSLTVAYCCASWLVVAGVLAVGCTDDDPKDVVAEGGSGNQGGSSDPGDGGSDGSGATSNQGGSSAEAGQSGSMGGEPAVMGGTGNAGGAPAEGGTGGDGNGPADLTCESFPLTLALGPTIQLDVNGAILCLDPCRVTSNTYSDGADACANADNGVGFFADSSNSPNNFARLNGDWTWESTSAGTISQDFPYVLDEIPSGTEVTAVASAADQTEYTVVFTFLGGGELTITSFTEN